MLLGAGIPQRVWLRMTNTSRQRVWRDGYDCIWKQNGVWDFDSRGRPQLLLPDYFTQGDEPEAAFRRSFYPAFAKRFANCIREIHPEALIFFQGEPGERAPSLTTVDLPNLVFAPHWYDGTTLMIRRYWNHIGADIFTRQLVLGADAIQNSFAAQLQVFHHDAENKMGGVPVLLGEFGIPFDLHNKPIWRAADELLTTRALNRSFRALEKNMMSGTIWNYSADNTHNRGDSFNGEDMSIFSQSDRKDPSDINSGGRALRAVIRPYPRATAGIALKLHYDWLTKVFEFEFQHDPTISAPTEIFVPEYPYPNGYEVEVSDGEITIRGETLAFTPDAAIPSHRIVIKPKSL
jgi:hypothetical protein